MLSPFFCFNQDGDVERALLREGNVHGADDWRNVLEPVVERYRKRRVKRFFRGDAAFANPGIYEYLEGGRFSYASRLKANAVLYDEISHLMKRQRGRPPKEPVVWYHSFRYRANTWDRRRRVVAKVEWHEGELFPRIGFIVTNLRWKSSNVVRFYNQRGTSEQWTKEEKYALDWTRLSCHDFEDNQVRLRPFVLAYNLGNFLRRLALTNRVEEWSLTTLKERLFEIGAKVIRHARYTTFQLAEVAVPRTLMAGIPLRITRVPVFTPGPSPG